jgi:hypothetical protein
MHKVIGGWRDQLGEVRHAPTVRLPYIAVEGQVVQIRA